VSARNPELTPAETPADEDDHTRQGVTQVLDEPDIAAGSMSKSVASGVSWVAAAKLGTQGAQFLSGLVLARLLTPHDFGTIASVYVITGFTVLLFDLGFGPALVQLRDLTEQDLSTAFWINLLGGVVFALLLAAAGPLLASFYSQPALVYITPILALSFTFNVGICNRALLARRMLFQAATVVEVGAAVAGFTTSIVLALLGAGVVSLAVGPVVQSIVLSAGLWVVAPWRPSQFIAKRSVRRLWRFSGGMLGFNVVNYWSRNADNLLVARVLGASALGYYARAYNLMLMPIQQVSQVVGRVMFPALTAMRDDKARVGTGYRRALHLINAITVPVLAALTAVAPGLVPLLWGPAWDATIPLLQILCLAGIPQCLAASVGWLYQSQGRTGTMFRMGLWTSAVQVLAIIVGLHWGTTGVALAILAKTWILSPITLYVPCRIVGLSASRVLLENTPTLLLAAVMAGLAWLVPVALGASREDWWIVIVQLIVAAAVYGGGTAAFRPRVMSEVRVILRRGQSPVMSADGARAAS
jgi:O-antigen/teichoic acid export membrane protein